MKKIKNSSYKALSLIFAILSTGHNLQSQSLLGGSLQFAKNATLDDISIRHCGKTITTQKHEVSIPKITYEIPKSSDQKKFCVLITPTTPVPVAKKMTLQDGPQNTIDYFKISPNADYLFYTLELIETNTSDPTQSKTDKLPTYRWEINEDKLPETGQIPDMAIIITYFPSFIKGMKGGNQLELPTIYIDNSAIDTFGSQENFQDALIKLQLSSLDLNALHAPTKRKTKTDNKRLLIMDTLT